MVLQTKLQLTFPIAGRWRRFDKMFTHARKLLESTKLAVEFARETNKLDPGALPALEIRIPKSLEPKLGKPPSGDDIIIAITLPRKHTNTAAVPGHNTKAPADKQGTV